MPYPSTPFGPNTPETALWPFQGWPAGRAGSLWPSSTPFGMPLRMPMKAPIRGLMPDRSPTFLKLLVAFLASGANFFFIFLYFTFVCFPSKKTFSPQFNDANLKRKRRKSSGEPEASGVGGSRGEEGGCRLPVLQLAAHRA
jgi:hypothetical protein